MLQVSKNVNAQNNSTIFCNENTSCLKRCKTTFIQRGSTCSTKEYLHLNYSEATESLTLRCPKEGGGMDRNRSALTVMQWVFQGNLAELCYKRSNEMYPPCPL